MNRSNCVADPGPFGGLLAWCAATAASALVAGAVDAAPPKSSGSAPPPPKAAPAPAPKAAPARKPADFGVRPDPYKSVTINALTSVPVPLQAKRPDARPEQAREPAAAPYGSVTMQAPAVTALPRPSPVAPALAKPKVARAAAVAAPAIAAAGLGADEDKPRSRVDVGGLPPAVADHLKPEVARFEQTHRAVKVVKEPTTSGWTWLFLAWALSNSSENSELRRDKRALESRMEALDRELRQDPAQWAQLQELSASAPAGAPAGVSASAPAPTAHASSGGLAGSRQTVGPSTDRRAELGRPHTMLLEPMMDRLRGAVWWVLVALLVVVLGTFYVRQELAWRRFSTRS